MKWLKGLDRQELLIWLALMAAFVALVLVS